MLRSLVLGHQLCPMPDFEEEPWSSSILIMPRHAVRQRWNQAALEKHCIKTNNTLFICNTEDRIKGNSLTLQERYAVALRKHKNGFGGQQSNKDMPDQLSLAIGMSVLITENIETDLDITNGARGHITGIILHPDEQSESESSIRVLNRLPIYILVALNQTRTRNLEGLLDGVVPIIPSSQQMYIKVMINTVEKECMVVHCQLLITSAYAFTDYCPQGQMIKYMIADIVPLLTGSISLFNMYVTLGQAPLRASICLLQDFDTELLLNKSMPIELDEEDDCLEALNSEFTLVQYNYVSA